MVPDLAACMQVPHKPGAFVAKTPCQVEPRTPNAAPNYSIDHRCLVEILREYLSENSFQV